MSFYTRGPDKSIARQLRRDAEDQQPWRCAKCGEAVNRTTKRDCACTRALGGITPAGAESTTEPDAT